MCTDLPQRGTKLDYGRVKRAPERATLSEEGDA